MLSVFVDMYGKAYVARTVRSPLDSYVPYPSPILVAWLLEDKGARETHIEEVRLQFQHKMSSATDEQRAELLEAANDVIAHHEAQLSGDGSDRAA